MALGLDSHAGAAAAAGVLFAVNVTAVIPATPANVGVFQAACVAVLAGAYHVSTPDAIAYGIVLQAVEVATALLMGVPALLNEGLSWRDVRLRTMHADAGHARPAARERGTPAHRRDRRVLSQPTDSRYNAGAVTGATTVLGTLELTGLPPTQPTRVRRRPSPARPPTRPLHPADPRPPARRTAMGRGPSP